MQWSKTKATLESFLCDKLKGRINMHATVYRKSHDGPARVWITFDNEEILSASDLTYAVKHEKLYNQVKKERELKPIPYHADWEAMFHSPERKDLIKASDEAEEMLTKQSIFGSHHLYAPFMDYASLSIDEAMTSDNVIISAYAMFDRRLGKRRLEKLELPEGTHPLIVKFYEIRCAVEGITSRA